MRRANVLTSTQAIPPCISPDVRPLSAFALPTVVLLCALLSIAISGLESGTGNNLFHLPIIERLYDQPQFANDTFVQSLRYYSSGFWMLLTGLVGREEMLNVFLPLQIISRVLFFVGVLSMARPLGVADRRSQCMLLVLVAVSAMLRGEAPAGGGGLFSEIFTHSELANATVLITLALAARNRFGWALVAVGMTAFINLFMAVWLLPPIAMLMAVSVHKRLLTFKALAVQVVWGGLLCLTLITPVLLNIFGNSEFGRSIGFDYRGFLVDYWPVHFIIWEVPKKEIIKFLVIAAAGLSASFLLPVAARRLMVALIAGFMSVWVLGTILPLMTSSPTLLNLHLLRSSVVVIMLAVLAIAALTINLFNSQKPADRLFWAPALVCVTAFHFLLIPLVIVIPAIRARWSPPDLFLRRSLLWVILAFVGAKTGAQIAKSVVADRDFRAGQVQWIALADWARTHTAPTTMFMLPIKNFNLSSSLPKSQLRAFPSGYEVFTSVAQRPTWVGFKEGAAVMWLPSYYKEWRQRATEVLKLNSLPARIDYAREHGIAMIVDSCDQAGVRKPTYRFNQLCIFPVRGVVP
jgi:hypothetical protein